MKKLIKCAVIGISGLFISMVFLLLVASTSEVGAWAVMLVGFAMLGVAVRYRPPPRPARARAGRRRRR